MRSAAQHGAGLFAIARFQIRHGEAALLIWRHEFRESIDLRRNVIYVKPNFRDFKAQSPLTSTRNADTLDCSFLRGSRLKSS